MTRKPFIGLVLVLSLFLGACVAKPASMTGAESPDVSLTGVITQAGTKFTIRSAEKGMVELDSRKVDLSKYLNTTVGVKGQYSGTTLFVDSVDGVSTTQ